MSMRPGSRSKVGGLATGRTLIVVVVALLLGAFILKRALGSDTKTASTVPGAVTTAKTTVPKGGVTTAPTTVPVVTTTTIALNLATNKVLVANAAGVEGLAGRVTQAIQTKGYVPQLPAATATAQAALTVVYFNPTPGADRVARFVATDLGLPATVVQAMPAAKPVKDLALAQVLVVLGQDFKEAGILKTSSVTAPAAAAPVTAAPAAAVTPAVAVTQPTTTKKP